MLRKCLSLLAALTASTVVFAGLSLAQDDESPLHTLMEGVNKNNAALVKSLKSVTSYKKDQSKAVVAADKLVKAAKESRKDTSAVKKQNKTTAEWYKLSDDFIKKSEDLSNALAKGTSKKEYDVAKAAHTAVKASCSNCHEVFRIEDKDDK
jgi:cytochrome c556